MMNFISKNKLLATTAICAVMLCAKSYALEPTLDTLKAQSTTLSGSYILTELGSNTLPEGATKVKIGNTVYYFTPSGDNADLLKALAGTVAGNLVEDANGVFEFNGTKYGFNVSAIPNSIFSYGTGDETNYHFITQESDDEGNLTTTYHTISLKPENFSTSPNITWTPVDESKKDEANVIAVNLPNDDVKYFQYTWTEVDTTRDKYTERQENTLSGDVVGDFIGVEYETSSSAQGGAIRNYGTISSITGDFTGNSATATGEYSYAHGGAIYNQGTISSITGDFTGNSSTSTNSYAYGGAIYNNGTIESISGDFTGNIATSTNSFTSGGAIYNGDTIETITGDFIGNSATGNPSAAGGAISNIGTISSITGDFTGNSATSTYGSAYGGAIYNGDTIEETITGDFTGNSATATNSSAYGGAIYNGDTIETITGDFTGNSATGSSAYGGAIFNEIGTIETIEGNFEGNSATSTNSSAYGGAILNEGTISSIIGDFTGNSATSTNSYAEGGAIENYGTISSISGDFVSNSATGNSYADGGAIYNDYNGTISSITGDFIGNSAIGKSASAGAIDNGGTISSITGDFIGNSATSTNRAAYGGAIFNDGTINFVADASDSEDSLQDDVLFQGNYIQSGNNDKQYQAIYNNGTINFAANNGGSYTFYDYIEGDWNSGTINFTADGGIGTLNLYDKAYIGSQQAININDAYVINLAGDGLTRDTYLSNLNLNADISLNVDVSFDCENNWNTWDTADKIYGNMTKADGVSFELGRVNILSDMGEEMDAYRGIYNNNSSGILTDNIGEMNITSDTGTEYDGYNDGRYISIYKQNLSGGLAGFLANRDRTSTTYDFTGDENLKLWFGPNGKRAWIEGDTTDKTITINGNGHKISPNIKGISGFLDNFLDNYNNYGENELIINNLTIEGFGGVDAPYVLEGNNITLNNVIFQNSHGRIWNDIYGNIYNSKFINNSYIFDGEGENSGSVYGLNIENYSDIDTINADFIGTHVSMQNTTYTDVYGGAVDNEYKVENLHGNFVSNVVELKDTTGEAYVYGGALYNYGRINSLSGDFLDNHIKVENTENLYVYGGAVYNYGKSILQTMVQDWHGYGSFEEYAQNEWGMSGEDLLAEYGISSEEDVTPEIAMYMNSGYLSIEDFINGEGYDSLEEMLDAYDYSSIREMAEDGDYYDGGITFVADASDSEDTLQDDVLFKGNYIEVNRDRRYEAIYNEGIINFESNNGGSYTFYDYIDGNNATLNFVSDNNEKAIFNLYNNIQNQKDINFQSAYVINMISADDIRVGTSKYSYIQAQNININAALQMMLDIDLKNKKIDHFDAESFTIADGGSINVTQFNIVTDLTGDIGSTTEVEFILSDNSTGLDKITNITEAVGVKYIYSVSFNPKTGAFEFSIIDKKSPEEVVPDQTPSLTPPTTVATVETVVAQIFERDVIISADTNYCIVNVANKKNLWVKTFGSDDDLKLDNFNGTIDSKTYGIIGGVDSKVFTYNNRVKVAYGVYGAYVGGKQKYDSYKNTQDSGYLGLSASFRKDRLFSNFTVNGGYITSKASTEWGTDKFDTKAVSIANKTGVDIKVGCYWTVIPALYVAYTGLDTEDYTNRAGVKIENDFTHVATIAPEVKVRRYFGKSFSGYAKASYKHYIYDSKVKANDVILEEMSVKPYIEYGFGAKKTWTDSSTYAEITRRDGGRKGWNVNLGLRLDF